jgi:hypothetical protein
MGFRFSKKIKICKGVSVNLGKKGVSSVSVGTRGARVTFGKNGTTRTTVGLPGSGISYTDYKKHDNVQQNSVKPNRIAKPIYELPTGVEIPKYKMKFTALYVGVITGLLSFVNILFLPICFISLLVFCIKMLFNKGFRNALYTQKAMWNFRCGYWDKCIKYCNKSLKLDENNEHAKKLIEEINKMNTHL